MNESAPNQHDTFEAFIRAQIGKKIQNSPSPLANWLNAEIVDVAVGFVKLKYEVRKDFTNPMGILHGGIAAAMLDDLMGMMVFTLNRQRFYATTNLHVEYYSPARLGEHIIGEAKVTKAGKRTINAEASLVDLNGKPLSRGTSHLIEAFNDLHHPERPEI